MYIFRCPHSSLVEVFLGSVKPFSTLWGFIIFGSWPITEFIVFGSITLSSYRSNFMAFCAYTFLTDKYIFVKAIMHVITNLSASINGIQNIYTTFCKDM